MVGVWATPHTPEICTQSDPHPFKDNDFDHGDTMLVLLWPPNFHLHRGWLPPNQHRHRVVLQCSRQSFWALFPENCPSLPQSSDSNLNVMFIPHEGMVIWSWRHCPPPPHVCFPTRKQQDCRGSSDSLGTVLRPLRRSHLVHPYCRVQWAISTFQDSWKYVISTYFWLTTLALTPTIFATATGTAVACQKTLPPTELQIPATITTLHRVTKTYLPIWQSADTNILIGQYRLTAK